MTAPTASLNELIAVLHDGIAFHDEAAARTRNVELRDLFQRMAAAKRDIVGELQAVVAAHGDRPSEHGTLAGTLRQAYVELRARLSEDPDLHYVSQLEEAEDRILAAFQEALTASEHAQVRQLAQTFLPEVRRMHGKMRELKEQCRRAA